MSRLIILVAVVQFILCLLGVGWLFSRESVTMHPLLLQLVLVVVLIETPFLTFGAVYYENYLR